MTTRFAGCALLLLASSPLQAQTGAFVVRLGTDTIAVERFQRTGDRVEGGRFLSWFTIERRG